MATKQRKDFLESQEGQEIRRMLQRMTDDSAYNTVPGYSADTLRYPDHVIPFAEKHLNYLNAHPKLDAGQYIANIKLMSRVR